MGSVIFHDMIHAAIKLVEVVKRQLKKAEEMRESSYNFVLAIPRGEVAISDIIAAKLDVVVGKAKLDVVVSRKISAPNDP